MREIGKEEVMLHVLVLTIAGSFVVDSAWLKWYTRRGISQHWNETAVDISPDRLAAFWTTQTFIINEHVFIPIKEYILHLDQHCNLPLFDHVMTFHRINLNSSQTIALIHFKFLEYRYWLFCIQIEFQNTFRCISVKSQWQTEYVRTISLYA